MDKKINYFAVVYCYDETIHLWKGDSQEECLEKLRKMMQTPKIAERMKATTVIKRDMSNFVEDMIFGCPKSLNVVTESKPKKAAPKKEPVKAPTKAPAKSSKKTSKKIK